jgi:hypothetical protein
MATIWQLSVGPSPILAPSEAGQVQADQCATSGLYMPPPGRFPASTMRWMLECVSGGPSAATVVSHDGWSVAATEAVGALNTIVASPETTRK